MTWQITSAGGGEMHREELQVCRAQGIGFNKSIGITGVIGVTEGIGVKESIEIN